MGRDGGRPEAHPRSTRDLKFQAAVAFWLSSTQDYAAALITPAVGYSLIPRRINP